MNNSQKNTANAENKDVKNINGDTVDTATGEILNGQNENKETAVKHPTTESEAREYIASLPYKHINVKELYETMQVPSCSKYEFRMASYIMLWARRNNIKYDFDKKGNLYLTKGELAEGEFYPCVTSHMDTVQDKAKPYALAGAELPLRTRRIQNTNSDTYRHEIFIDGQGIGADDKLGVYISLQLMSRVDKIKAAFFVEEEIGMMGSKELNKDFFNDVAYVIGWDSPDLLRAAWRCSGTQLFTADFYKNHLKPVTDKWGFSDKCFHSEPFTDVVNIVEKTGIVCMNFGNGGYNAHASNEYLIIEHVDHAAGMGLDIINSIGNKEQFKIAKKSYTYDRTSTGGVAASYEDERECEKLFGYVSSNYYGGGNYNTNSGNSSNNTGTNRSDGKVENKPDENSVNEETIQYMVDTYDDYIKGLKEDIEKKCDTIEDAIKDKFREAGIDFSTFGIDIKKELTSVFSKAITF